MTRIFRRAKLNWPILSDKSLSLAEEKGLQWQLGSIERVEVSRRIIINKKSWSNYLFGEYCARVFNSFSTVATHRLWPVLASTCTAGTGGTKDSSMLLFLPNGLQLRFIRTLWTLKVGLPSKYHRQQSFYFLTPRLIGHYLSLSKGPSCDFYAGIPNIYSARRSCSNGTLQFSYIKHLASLVRHTFSEDGSIHLYIVKESS